MLDNSYEAHVMDQLSELLAQKRPASVTVLSRIPVGYGNQQQQARHSNEMLRQA